MAHGEQSCERQFARAAPGVPPQNPASLTQEEAGWSGWPAGEAPQRRAHCHVKQISQALEGQLVDRRTGILCTGAQNPCYWTLWKEKLGL